MHPALFVQNLSIMYQITLINLQLAINISNRSVATGSRQCRLAKLVGVRMEMVAQETSTNLMERRTQMVIPNTLKSISIALAVNLITICAMFETKGFNCTWTGVDIAIQN